MSAMHDAAVLLLEEYREAGATYWPGPVVSAKPADEGMPFEGSILVYVRRGDTRPVAYDGGTYLGYPVLVVYDSYTLRTPPS